MKGDHVMSTMDVEAVVVEMRLPTLHGKWLRREAACS